MSDAFLDEIVARLERSQLAGMRLGTLSAVDTTDASVTVLLDGQPVTGVRWVGSYTPVVGDLVVVSRVGAMWVVLGKLSKQLGSPSVRYETVTVAPFESQQTWLIAGTWSWQAFAPGSAQITQGAADGLDGSAGILRYYPLAPSIPSGATVTAARLQLRRAHSVEGDTGLDLVQPVLYGHAGTLGPGAPAYVPGYGPWRPGTIGHDETASWEIPSSWLTAWLAGTITGLAMHSTAAADNAVFAGALDGAVTVTYTLPA